MVKEGLQVKFQRIMFTSLGEYTEVPPHQVLSELRAAKATGIFDSFQVAYAEEVFEVRSSVPERKRDPILFGRITGCGDYFLISQWGGDVTFEQIVKGSELKERPKS